MKTPKISIVTPSFNQAQYLETTIRSVLNQEYPNLEYIIIDGGSTDGSQKIIEKYESHLAYWSSVPDGGQYDAINKGFSKSTGEIMAWLNSDDLYFPWTFSTVASVMQQFPEVRWLSSLLPYVWDAHNFFLRYYKRSGFSFEAFLNSCYAPLDIGSRRASFIQQESTFWRRDLWNISGGMTRSEMHLAADFELWSRFFEHETLYGVYAPLAGFRMHGQQKSKNIDLYNDEVRTVLENCRGRNHWKPDLLKRNLWYLLRFDIIFDVLSTKAPYLVECFGYSGKKVVRRLEEDSTVVWKLEEYTFFPWVYR
jgi:glycosyltransferase involved in cell wall biosynthesis